jgi:hypothetical protein
VLASTVLAGLAACGGADDESLPQGSEPVRLDQSDFTTEIDNPYWPMVAGNRWIYRETDAAGNEQRVEVTVTAETKTVAGLEARVVHDVVTEDAGGTDREELLAFERAR